METEVMSYKYSRFLYYAGHENKLLLTAREVYSKAGNGTENKG